MLYGASRPHTEYFITHVHAITNLLCFSSVSCITKVAVLDDSYSMASSFDPPTQNAIM